MKETVATFFVFLILVCSNYSAPEPFVSPLQGIAGIGNCDQLDEIGANAWYQWKPIDPKMCDDFIPMMRDADQYQQLYSGEVVITPTLLLGFNEPDLCPDQACLTPEEALPLEHWRLTHYTQTLHASPAPSQNDIYWLRDLRDLYIGEYDELPGWDYLAAHCYFYDNYSLSLCKSKLSTFIQWSNDWGADGVLVTEFGSFAITYNPEDPFNWAGAVSRADNFIDWMEQQPEIQGYFWYSTNDWGAWPWYMTTALYNDGELTPLGEMYQEQVGD